MTRLAGLRACLVLLVVARPAAAEVRFEARCDLSTGCVFTNTGDEAGSACAAIVVRHRGGQTVRSSTACSGVVPPNTTGAPVPTALTGVPPFECALPSDCTPTVELSNLRAEGAVPWGWLMFAVVALTSAWVFLDAKKRRVPPGPGTWFVGCLLLWFLAFPWYLWKRRESPATAG